MCTSRRKRSRVAWGFLIAAAFAYGSPLAGTKYLGAGPGEFFRFTQQSMEEVFDWADDGTDRPTARTYTYSIEESHGVPFLVLDREKGVERSLILYSNEVMFLSTSSPPYRMTGPYFTPQPDCWRSEFWYTRRPTSVSSYLTEGATEYRGANIRTFQLDRPWVEGVDGLGIGETIEFPETDVGRLHWSSGYVSYEKPYLYEQNARPRRILVTDELNDEEWVFELVDTPNPQELSFGERKNRKLTVELLNVYPGTRYEDTCVNFVVFELCATSD